MTCCRCRSLLLERLAPSNSATCQSRSWGRGVGCDGTEGSKTSSSWRSCHQDQLPHRNPQSEQNLFFLFNLTSFPFARRYTMGKKGGHKKKEAAAAAVEEEAVVPSGPSQVFVDVDYLYELMTFLSRRDLLQTAERVAQRWRAVSHSLGTWDGLVERFFHVVPRPPSAFVQGASRGADGAEADSGRRRAMSRRRRLNEERAVYGLLMAGAVAQAAAFRGSPRGGEAKKSGGGEGGSEEGEGGAAGERLPEGKEGQSGEGAGAEAARLVLQVNDSMRATIEEWRHDVEPRIADRVQSTFLPWSVADEGEADTAYVDEERKSRERKREREREMDSAARAVRCVRTIQW